MTLANKAKVLSAVGLAGLTAPLVYKGIKEILQLKSFADIAATAKNTNDKKLTETNQLLSQIAATLKPKSTGISSKHTREIERPLY